MWNLFKSNKQYVLDRYPKAYICNFPSVITKDYTVYLDAWNATKLGSGKSKRKAWKDAKNYIKHYQEESIKSQIRKIGVR